MPPEDDWMDRFSASPEPYRRELSDEDAREFQRILRDLGEYVTLEEARLRAAELLNLYRMVMARRAGSVGARSSRRDTGRNWPGCGWSPSRTYLPSQSLSRSRSRCTRIIRPR